MERVTVYRPEGAVDELRVVVDLNERAGERIADRVTLRDGKLAWDFDRVEAVERGYAEAPRGASAAVKSGGAVIAAAPQPAMGPEDDARGGGAGGGAADPAAGAIKTPWRKSRRYTGKRINLTIKDANIQHVLTFLAKEGKVNIIAGPDVQGEVTFHLENIPWDLALDVILRARGYDYVRQHGVIRVAPIEALKKEFDAEVERRQKMEDVKQLVVRIIPVNYASAEGLTAQVKEILSKKGTVTVDTRTNALVVKDTEDHVAAVEEMVRKLDGQTPQVLIEARVVEASSAFNKEVGIQWGGNYSMSSVYGNETGLPFPSVIGVAGGADGGVANKDGVAISVPQYAVNLPAATGTGAGGAIGLTLGSLGGVGNLNLRLSAAEQEGVVKIVSSPKVLTLDNNTATIRQGISIPISVVSSQGVQTRFFNADLALRTTPHITQDGNIRLSVNVSKNEPDFSNRAADGNPTITQREATTELLLGDGETTVIGGIYTRSTSNSVRKVPFFGDIPLFGALFRTRREEDKRTELLIFITPRIVNRSSSLTVGK
jgi:type IV pilus assembly protein PilQ